MTPGPLPDLLKFLDQSQWWSEQARHQYQSACLSGIIRHAAQTVPYYQQLFASEGIAAEAIDSPAALCRLPVLKRFDIQEAGPALISPTIPRRHGTAVTKFTSGSTAAPIQVQGSQFNGLIWQAMTLRDHLWHRRDLSGSLAAIRFYNEGIADPPHGTSAPNWGSATAALTRTGPAHMLSVFATVEQQAAWLLQKDPDYLITFPTVARSLSEYRQQHGLQLPRLKQIRTIGEALDPDVRQMIQQTWNVPVVDIYSAEETGNIALQCPDHEHYHVCAEDLIVEILDEQDQPCPSGQVGRVVVTSLHNYAMPLLRYEIGDYAVAGDACPCGRGLPVLTRVLGRSRNMMLHPDGNRVFPSLEMSEGDDVLQLPVRQWQVVQRNTERLDAYLVTLRQLTPDEEGLITRTLHRTVRYPFPIHYHYVDRIPRGPTGKYEEFRCDIRPSEA